MESLERECTSEATDQMVPLGETFLLSQAENKKEEQQLRRVHQKTDQGPCQVELWRREKEQCFHWVMERCWKPICNQLFALMERK
ncbi:uncharacterized protein PHA67_004060 isoform 8-T9 [Liasis olivaceus]